MITVPKIDLSEPTTKKLGWSAAKPAEGEKPAEPAKLRCAHGHVTDLTGYSIAANGKMGASFVCPAANCSWSACVRLGDWTPA